MRFLAFCLALWFAPLAMAADGNRLAYLDETDPYYPNRDFPPLTTPSWVGEEGVEAVVILAIDDMRDTAKYEAYLRPILDRLKQIDGRAPMSIMTNQVDPRDPQLQAWIQEGVSIECHTLDHPCPLLTGGDFAKAKATYDGCVDLMASIPNNRPVAFRMPCCDSLNTVSPRFFAEILSQQSPQGNRLQIDTSVFNILTPNDPALPRDLVYEPGTSNERFRKYLPFPSFVNTIEDYPYPYVIAGNCWEFPCVVPSDWEAQNIQQPNNPKTVEDLKAALDCVVIKQGVFPLVFHPHGWIRAEQIVELIDHAQHKHGAKVKFLSFRDAAERLPNYSRWLPLLHVTPLVDEKTLRASTPAGAKCIDTYVIDIDGDRRSESVVTFSDGTVALFGGPRDSSERLPCALPAGTTILDAERRDAGLRFVDIDEDGDLDILFSNETRCSLHLFESLEKGWSREIFACKQGEERAIPPFLRNGTNNGAWFHSRHVWWQNEDTAHLPDLVDRRSFQQLLGNVDLPARSAEASLKALRVRSGLKIELVAAEPLVMDPVAFDWGRDGKLWVCEMGDYPLGADNKGAPGGRVRYLEDTDCDGKYDRSTLFLEGLHYPNGVLAWGDGVLVSNAPEVFYAEDTNGDGRADKRESLLTGFSEANPQHRVNGFTLGLDNWVHCAMGESGGAIHSVKLNKDFELGNRDFRFRPDTGEIDPQTGVTQFQRIADDWGNWFGSDNIHPLWHYVLPDEYLRRNPHIAAPQVLQEVPEVPGAAPVFPTSRTLARYNDFHLSNHITSACGVANYRDTVLGADLYGNSFVCEPVHNLVHREVLTLDGASFHSHRAPEEAKSEFLTSADNWFRPVMIRTGPDGALYVADFYRQILEHPEWIPDDIEAKIDLLAGHDRGRIYRIVPVAGELRAVPKLSAQSITELVAHLESPNGTLRDMAQRELVRRHEESATAPLRTLATEGKSPAARLHAICALDGLSEMDADTVLRALRDAHAGVRRHAMRLSLPLLDNEAVVQEVRDARWLSEQDAAVRLQYAATVGELPTKHAAPILAALLAKEWDDAYLRAAVVSSLNGAKFRACLPHVLNGKKQNNLPSGLIETLPEWALALDAPDACREILEFAFRDEQDRPVEQLAIAAATLRALRERNLDLTSIGLKDSAKLLAQLRGTAEKSLRDDAAAIPLRLAALEIVSREANAESLAQIALAFAPSAPAELRDAAVARLVAMENTAAFDALLEAWRGFTPQVRGMALDECFERAAQLPIVLDALESGRIQPSDFDADRRQRFAMAAGAELRDRVVKALSADIQTDRRQVVEDYADVLRLTADATRGQEVFRNKCGVCHRLNNIGFAVGADLAALTDKSPSALLTAILDPNRALETKFVNYTAQTAEGLTLTGMLVEESGASITLQGQEGKLQSIPRSQIEAFESTGKSLMPEGLEKDLTRQDLADVMAYVANVPTPHKEFPGNEPAVVTADENGALKLTAVRAEIFGPTLVFEAGTNNLGFWGSEADRASWNAHVEQGGRYRVWLHYSCHDDTANNSFSVRCGDQRVSAKVIGTGTWDYYRREPIGVFDLAPGAHRITIQSDGPIAGHLMDLFELSLEPVAE